MSPELVDGVRRYVTREYAEGSVQVRKQIRAPGRADARTDRALTRCLDEDEARAVRDILDDYLDGGASP